jgi:predicted neuraminidase
MRTMTGLRIVAAGVLMLAMGCSTGAAQKDEPVAKKERKKMTIPEAEKAPDAFAEQVRAAGGRVDFVFEDDRPFAECHASTVVETGNGDLLAAWFGGTEEKNPDVGVWWSRFSNGAWAAPTRAAKVGERAHWNPVLFRDAEGALYLFFKVGVDVPQWQTYWIRSDDDGKTWSEPVELVPGDIGGRGPVKNKAIILSDGAWLAPASTEAERWECFADRSEDHGKTWARSANFVIDPAKVRGEGAIQPTFWESAPGKVHGLMRTAGGFLLRADSEDYGKTWSEALPTDIPNNNSGVDALRLEDGCICLIYNPIGKNWGPRTPLYLGVSADNGVTWRNLAALETEPGEYSYPAIVKTKSGVAVSYTWKRERVRCWQIPLDALK